MYIIGISFISILFFIFKFVKNIAVIHSDTYVLISCKEYFDISIDFENSNIILNKKSQ